jgi:hypothetical protein
MDELVQWLRAVLDAEAEEAQATADEFGSVWTADETTDSVRSDIEYVSVVGEPNSPVGFIAEHDPARVLREIDAKRQILAEHRQAQPRWCVVCDVPGDYQGREFGCTTVRLLALPYADRPGYREEWRP